VNETAGSWLSSSGAGLRRVNARPEKKWQS